jgi:hypothetical protein
MIVKNLIEDIEGIMILLKTKVDHKVLTALKELDPKDIKDYRNSLALEWQVKHKNKMILLED